MGRRHVFRKKNLFAPSRVLAHILNPLNWWYTPLEWLPFAHMHIFMCAHIRHKNMWVNEVRVTSYAEPNTVGVTIDGNVICDEPRNGHPFAWPTNHPKVSAQYACLLPSRRKGCELVCQARWLRTHIGLLSYWKTRKYTNCEFIFRRRLKRCWWKNHGGMFGGFWGHHIDLFLRNQNRKNRIELSIPQSIWSVWSHPIRGNRHSNPSNIVVILPRTEK